MLHHHYKPCLKAPEVSQNSLWNVTIFILYPRYFDALRTRFSERGQVWQKIFEDHQNFKLIKSNFNWLIMVIQHVKSHKKHIITLILNFRCLIWTLQIIWLEPFLSRFHTRSVYIGEPKINKFRLETHWNR